MVSRVAKTIRRGRLPIRPVVVLLAIVINFAFDIDLPRFIVRLILYRTPLSHLSDSKSIP